MIEAVIFDLDGSMVDSMWVWKSIDIEYLGRFGIRLPEDLQASIGGKSFSETAVYFKERFGIPDEPQTIKEDWNRMAWEKYTHEVPLKKGVLELLQYCRGQGIKMGIATSHSRDMVECASSGALFYLHYDGLRRGEGETGAGYLSGGGAGA